MEVKNQAQKQLLPLISTSKNTNIKQDFTSNSVVFGSTILSFNPTLDLPQHQKLTTNSYSKEIYKSSPTPSPSSTPSPIPSPRKAQDIMIRYRECQRNHAAHLGSHVVDGCGEFMPAGDEGTPQAFRCAACDCHRNFHRREADGETLAATPSRLTLHPPPVQHITNAHPTATNTTTPTTNCYISFNKPQKITPVANHRHNTTQCENSVRHSTAMMMAFGSGGVAAESSSDDLNAYGGAEMGGQLMEQYGASKKRFRTKFTQEQKDKMMGFAEKIGWKIQKQDEEEVLQLCSELGIKRQVFKVWMHNNKQAMKRKQS